VPSFGRKLAVIRGEVEREIQALVSKRDNAHTHHPYHAWDPVPSLSAASAGKFTLFLNIFYIVAYLHICIFYMDGLFNELPESYHVI